jgi:hypothetical protein
MVAAFEFRLTWVMQNDTPIADAPELLPPPTSTGATIPPSAASRSADAGRYHSPRTPGIALQVAAGGVIAVGGVSLASRIRGLLLVDRLTDSPQSVTVAELDAFDQRALIIGVIGLAASLTLMGLLIALTSRLYRNLPTLSTFPRRFTDGWAIGAWFVPFLNLVRPKQIIDDIWRGTGTEQQAWWQGPRPSVPAFVHVWWGVLIATALVTRAAAASPDSAELDEVRDALTVGIVADLLWIAVGALTIWVGHHLVRRDEARARFVLSDPAPVGGPVAPSLLGAGAVGLVALLGGLLAFAPGTTSDIDEVDGSGGAEGILATDLVEGDCIDYPPEFDQPLFGELELVIGFERRPCDQPHDAEVIALVQHPAAPGAAYPGDSALVRDALGLCLDVFEPIVGLSFTASVLDIFTVTPADSWAFGDREIACLAVRVDGDPLTDTVVGAQI